MEELETGEMMSQTTTKPCILCGNPMPWTMYCIPNAIAHSCECRLCGNYIVAHTFCMAYENHPNNIRKRHELSSVARLRTEYGYAELVLDEIYHESFLKTGDPYITIPTLVSDKIISFLTYLRFKSKSFGKVVDIYPLKDYPLFFEDNPECVRLYLKHMVDEGYLLAGGYTGEKPNGYILTVKAWDFLSEKNINSKQSFVAMNFDNTPENTNLFQDGISPAISEAGFDVFRVDRGQYNSTHTIDNQIIAGINRSRFMVADFTGNKQNVYYEAGYAKGLGIYVIYTCKADFIGEVHFDIRNFPHILWQPENLTDFKEQLNYAITANLGRDKKNMHV